MALNPPGPRARVGVADARQLEGGVLLEVLLGVHAGVHDDPSTEATFKNGQTGFVGETELDSPIYAGLGLKVGF